MNNPFKAISNMIARVVLDALNSANKCQTADTTSIGGDEVPQIEYLEPYGFTSAPQPGAEGIALFPDGDRSHGVVIVMADRRSRLTTLQPGEVAIYTDEGDSVILKRGRIVELTTETLNLTATKQININSPMVKSNGEIQDKTSSMSAMRSTFNGHDHKENGDGGGTTNPPSQKMG